MFQNTVEEIGKSARAKSDLLSGNIFGYIISSMLAGMFISFGSLVSTTMGALASDAGCTVTKLIMALLFASALSLVIMAGCELFTGNNLVMMTGYLRKEVTITEMVKLWLICWAGNFVGSWITVMLYSISGTASESVISLFVSTATAKVSMSAMQMFTRGVLCNVCVCLAVWCSFKMKNECGKLIMVIWCILIFMICGFEHSVANMSTIGIGLLNSPDSVTALGYFKNLLFVSLGNIVGGTLFVALPYYAIAKK